MTGTSCHRIDPWFASLAVIELNAAMTHLSIGETLALDVPVYKLPPQRHPLSPVWLQWPTPCMTKATTSILTPTRIRMPCTRLNRSRPWLPFRNAVWLNPSGRDDDVCLDWVHFPFCTATLAHLHSAPCHLLHAMLYICCLTQIRSLLHVSLQTY